MTADPAAVEAKAGAGAASGLTLQLRQVAAQHPAARAPAPLALKGVNLQLAAGEQVAVIGPSGAGKTTLLQVLACALPLAAGHYELNGQAPWKLPRRQLHRLRGQLFLAPQTPPLPPRQRVIAAVLAGRLPGMGWLASVGSLLYPHDIPAAHDALAHFNLQTKLFDRVDRLSGGERQRVGLARALLAPARLWLLDEPLSSLDPTHARQALAALTGAARERGLSLVATLHQVDMALAYFPRIIGLRDGQVAFDLPATAVTTAHLERLYGQQPAERIAAPWPAGVEAQHAEPAPPVALHCR